MNKQDVVDQVEVLLRAFEFSSIKSGKARFGLSVQKDWVK
jgi:hypothetical protein